MPRCTIQLLGRVHAASPLFIIVDALATYSARCQNLPSIIGLVSHGHIVQMA